MQMDDCVPAIYNTSCYEASPFSDHSPFMVPQQICTTAFKLQVTEYASTHSNHGAAPCFHIDESCVCLWCRSKPQLYT